MTLKTVLKSSRFRENRTLIGRKAWGKKGFYVVEGELRSPSDVFGVGQTSLSLSDAIALADKIWRDNPEWPISHNFIETIIRAVRDACSGEVKR